MRRRTSCRLGACRRGRACCRLGTRCRGRTCCWFRTSCWFRPCRRSRTSRRSGTRLFRLRTGLGGLRTRLGWLRTVHRSLRTVCWRRFCALLLHCPGTVWLHLLRTLLRADGMYIRRTRLVGSSGLRMLLVGRAWAAWLGGWSALRCNVAGYDGVALLDEWSDASRRLSDGLDSYRRTGEGDLCGTALVLRVELLLVRCSSAVICT